MRTQTRNLLLTIRYQGTAYHGFQVQKNALTVAQVLQDALEAVLGRREDIKGCSRTDSGVHANMFHARYSCTGKRYLYQINNSPVKDPFRWKQVYDYRYPIDVAMCDRQCKDFIGTHDFSSLCSAGSSVEDHVRTVTACGMVREGDRVTFYVEGDGFLYNMVRIMVGTILEIAAGSKPQGCIPQILEQRDRAAAGFTAPAWGLYLDRVFYEQLPDERMEG